MYELTDKELSVAQRVADWFDGSTESKEEKILKSDTEFIDACKFALEKQGLDWESVMLNRTRRKKVVEYRNAITLIVWRRISGTQSYKSKLLGGMLTRPTILHAVKTATDWIEYDSDYKELYGKLSNAINEYLIIH